MENTIVVIIGTHGRIDITRNQRTNKLMLPTTTTSGLNVVNITPVRCGIANFLSDELLQSTYELLNVYLFVPHLIRISKEKRIRELGNYIATQLNYSGVGLECKYETRKKDEGFDEYKSCAQYVSTPIENTILDKSFIIQNKNIEKIICIDATGNTIPEFFRWIYNEEHNRFYITTSEILDGCAQRGFINIILLDLSCSQYEGVDDLTQNEKEEIEQIVSRQHLFGGEKNKERKRKGTRKKRNKKKGKSHKNKLKNIKT